ncbi:MAG: T9SS type A sorting domain-containing protein [Bacteroidetes bacterium]|nr:T9SS type A sorting domain-containing protein [Bacteroidota bacterium]
MNSKSSSKKSASQLINKLKSYSIAAGAVLGVGTQADAAIIYTDVDPDMTYSAKGDMHQLDLNNDFTYDFTFKLLTFSGTGANMGMVELEALGSNRARAEFITIGASMTIGPLALNKYDPIQSTQMFMFGSGMKMAVSVTGIVSYSGGNWLGANDKYLGLQLVVGGNTYYGWARLDVAVDGKSFTIKDYAYENQPDVSILAGEAPSTDPATNVVATDIANNHNGSDMRVAFDKAPDETLVDSYRIIVVKKQDAASFNLADAVAVGSTNYLHIIKTGFNPQITLSPLATDKDGDLIVEWAPYNVFILTIADGVNAFTNALSAASNEITLTDPASIPEPKIEDYMSIYSFENSIYLNLFENVKAEGSISVYNLDGREVKNLALQDAQTRINLDRAGRNIYIVKVDLNGTLLTKKLFVN